MSRIINRVRGIRGSFRPGQVITTPTRGTGGPAQLSDINTLASQLTAAGVGGGAAGNGVPSGGTNGQVLAKVAGAVAWTFTTAITAVGTIATGVWNGTKIALAYGGTNADLSATGGAHKFLRQNSAGAAIDVVQVDYSDLSGTQPTNAITQLTGDVTAGPGSGSQAATLATVNSNVGTFGDGTHVAQVTVNGKGLITAASNVAITGGGGSGTVTSVSMTVPAEFSVSGSPITTAGTLAVTWANPVTLAHGGSGVNMSATGPGYVKQATLGANFTVSATIPYSDITGGPASPNYDVGNTTRAPIRQGSRMFLSQQLGGGMPAAGGICGGPLCSAPMTCDTLEWIVPVQVDNIATGAGRGLIWEGPVALGGMNGRWVPSSNLFALVNPHGLSYLALLGYGDKQTINATRANGSVATPTALSANDVLGRYTWVGYDGSATAFNNIMGSLVVTATENVTSSAAGSKIEFGVNKAGTTATGAGNPPTALTVKGEGCIIAGTNTNDNASAGIMGEVVSSNILTGSAVSLVSATAKDITTITLTAGDWEVSGVVAFKPAGTTTITQQIAALNTVTNTLPTLDPATPLEQQSGSAVTGVGSIMGTGTARVSLSATTTYRLIAQSTFATSTMAAYGYIYARRMR